MSLSSTHWGAVRGDSQVKHALMASHVERSGRNPAILIIEIWQRLPLNHNYNFQILARKISQRPSRVLAELSNLGTPNYLYDYSGCIKVSQGWGTSTASSTNCLPKVKVDFSAGYQQSLTAA